MSWKNGKRSFRYVYCRRCNNRKFHDARGLCKPCYNKVHAAGALEDYPLTRGAELDGDEVVT